VPAADAATPESTTPGRTAEMLARARASLKMARRSSRRSVKARRRPGILRRMKIVAFWIGVIGIIIIRIGIRRWIRVPVRSGISIGIIITVTGMGGTGSHETNEKEKEDILLLHKFLPLVSSRNKLVQPSCLATGPG
jgi:hypothetical protein